VIGQRFVSIHHHYDLIAFCLKSDCALLQVIIELNDWSWILCAAGAKLVKLLKKDVNGPALFMVCFGGQYAVMAVILRLLRPSIVSELQRPSPYGSVSLFEIRELRGPLTIVQVPPGLNAFLKKISDVDFDHFR